MAESSPNGWKTEGKREIPSYKKFLLFQQCFQKTCNVEMYKPGFVWERIISLPHNPDF